MQAQVLMHIRPDRLVVTYRNMTARGAAVNAPRSTFQAELFTAAGHFQPAGALRLSWLAVGAPAGVVGVSPGAGAAPALAADFSAAVRVPSVTSWCESMRAGSSMILVLLVLILQLSKHHRYLQAVTWRHALLRGHPVIMPGDDDPDPSCKTTLLSTV